MNAKKFTTGMLLSLGAGVATAYLTDPEFGKKRRAALAREARKFLDKATRETRRSLCDSQHRLSGFIARWRTEFKDETPDDGVLEARIRSRMGRVVSHSRKIHVLCDHGIATLWGLAPLDEISRLIASTEAIPGVREVVDHLEVGKPDESPADANYSLKHARDAARLNLSPSNRLVTGARRNSIGGLRVAAR